MQEQKLISIIIPAYNVEKYLGECLDSVLGQTYRNLEIICVDDGSTDQSLDLLVQYAARDKRIQVVSKDNSGLSSARNAGLRFATGEYVYFIDSDDKITPTAMEELLNVSLKEDLDVLFFDSVPFFETKELEEKFAQSISTGIRSKTYPDTLSGQKLFAYMFPNGDYYASACLCFLKRSFLEANKLRFYEGILHEDELFTFSVMLMAQRASHRSLKLFLRRVRADSIMTKPKTHNNFKGYFISFVEMLSLVQKTPLEPDAAPQIWERVIKMRKSALWIYSLLPEKEQKGVNWTDDLFTRSLFAMSEYQDWVHVRKQRETLLEEIKRLKAALRTPAKAAAAATAANAKPPKSKLRKAASYVLGKLRGGVRCCRELGFKYTVKLTLKKAYRLFVRCIQWLQKRKWGKPFAKVLLKIHGCALYLKQHGFVNTLKHAVGKILK